MLCHVDRIQIRQFLCDSLHFSDIELEQTLQRRNAAVKAGINEDAFWLELAGKLQIDLPENWLERFYIELESALHVDKEMYEIIDELKAKNVSVGLLSNLDERSSDYLRKFNLLTPFEPCLFSYQLGIDKLDSRIFRSLIETANRPACEIVFIDDKDENIQAALQLGIDAIRFESPMQVRDELIQRKLF